MSRPVRRAADRHRHRRARRLPRAARRRPRRAGARAAGQFAMLAAAERWGGGEDERPYLPRAFSIARQSRRRGALPARGRRARHAAAVRAARGRASCGRSVRSAVGSPRRTTAAARCSSAAASGSRRSRSCQDELRGARARDRAARLSRRAHAAGARAARAARASRPTMARSAITGWSPSCWPPSSSATRTRSCTRAGPPAMLEAVRAMCAAARGARRSSRSRPAMACGFGACFGCVVPARDGGYLRVCVDGPVIDAAALERVDAHAGALREHGERRVLRPRARAPGDQRLGHVRRDRRAARLRRAARRGLPVRRLRLEDDHARARAPATRRRGCGRRPAG